MSGTSSSTPLPEKRTAKCQAILDGAVKAFEQKGYEGASMDLVSELAGVSKRTVYNYFKSKDDLLWAVIGDLMAGQAVLKDIAYSPDESLESQLEKFVDAELYFVTDPSRVSLARILTSIFVINEELRAKAQAGCSTQNVVLVDWLKAAQADGRMHVPDPDLAATVFYGVVEGLFNFPALFRPQQTKEELQLVIDEAIAIYLSRYRAK